MPFVMLCGLPSSGKTSTTSKLVDYFNNLKKNVKVICDNDFITEKNSVYSGELNNNHLSKKQLLIF